MMMEPKIRLKGFCGEWKTQQIGDIATFSKGKGYSKADLCSEGNPIILYGSMYTNYSSVIDNVITFAPIYDGATFSKGNEVIIPASGETPEDIAIASAVKQKDVILGGDINIVNFDKEFEPAFMALTISNGKTHYELSRYAQGKTIVHLHNTEIAKGTISAPSLPEQRALATFFTSLDNQISAAEKRLASLKQVKAASLQAMFPQEGETTPKLRFKGYEGEWKKGFIKDYCKITTGKSNTQDKVENGKYPFFIRSEEVQRSNKYLYDCEAVITIGDGNIGKVFHYINGKFDLHQRCYMMYDFKGIDVKYFYRYFSTFFYDRAIKMSAKATVDSVRLDMISDMEILYPESESEQRQIASYFTSLDRQITVQSSKRSKLRQIKSACLDQMFV